MAGLSLWVRREWSRRWLGLLGLAALIAMVGGITLAVVGRRPPDGDGIPAAAGVDQLPRDTGRSARRPRTRLMRSSSTVPTADEPGRPDRQRGRGARVSLTMTYVAATADPDELLLRRCVREPAEGTAPDGPCASPGRLPGLDAPDEIAVNETALELWGAEVGRPLTIHTLGRDQMLTFLGLEPAARPGAHHPDDGGRRRPWRRGDLRRARAVLHGRSRVRRTGGGRGRHGHRQLTGQGRPGPGRRDRGRAERHDQPLLRSGPR